MLMATAMSLSLVPFTAAPVAARTVDEVVVEDVLDGSTITPYGEGDKYLHVNDITDKDGGVEFAIDADGIASGDVVKLSVRLRPAIGVHNYVQSVNNKKADGTSVKNEASGASGKDDRGFLISVNGTPIMGTIYADADSDTWKSDGYKPACTVGRYEANCGGTYSNQTWSYNNLLAQTEGETGYAPETLAEGDTYSTSELFAYSALTKRDGEGWLTYTAVFKMSDINNALVATEGEGGVKSLGRLAGIALSDDETITVKIIGSDGERSCEDVAPFDVDDLRIYKAEEGTAVSAANVAIASGDDEIIDEEFDSASTEDMATAIESTVFHVHDDVDYYRTAATMFDATCNVSLYAGSYKLVGDFRLSGYNGNVVGYNGVTPEIGNDWNWRELRVMYSTDGSNYNDLTLVNTDIRSTQGGGSNAMIGPQTEDGWVHIEWTLPAQLVGQSMDITRFRFRGGTSGNTVAKANAYRTAAGLAALPTVNENSKPYGSTAADGVDLPASYYNMGLDHRHISFDAKNVQIVKNVSYTYDEPEVSDTANQWDITGNVLPEATATVNGTANAPTVEAGYKDNKYLQFYDRANSGLMTYTVDAPVAAGTDIYVSFEGRAICADNTVSTRLLSSVAGARLMADDTKTYADFYATATSNGATIDSVKTDGVSVFVLDHKNKVIKDTVTFFTPTTATALGLTPYYKGDLSPMTSSSLNCNNDSSFYFYNISSKWQYNELVLKSVAAHTNMTITLQRGMNGAYNTPLEIDNFKVFYFPGNDITEEPIYLEYQTFDDIDSVDEIFGASGTAGKFYLDTKNQGKVRLIEDKYTVDIPKATNASVTYTWDVLPSGEYTLSGDMRLDYFKVGEADSANLTSTFKDSAGTDSTPMTATAITSTWSAIPEVVIRQEKTGPATLTISLDAAKSFKLSELALVKTGKIHDVYTVTVEAGSNGSVEANPFLADDGDKILDLVEGLSPAPAANYTFDGWYIGDTKVTEETTLSGNTTVTAKFVPASYEFVEDDAGNIMTVEGLTNGKATYLTDLVITVTSDAEPTVIVTIGDGNPVTLDNNAPSGNVYTYTVAGNTITGKVTVKASAIQSYTVTFATKDGEANGEFTALEFTVFEGEKLTADNIEDINAVNGAKPGYKLLGWNTDVAATEAGVYNFADLTYDADTTFYAIYAKDNYTLTVPTIGSGEEQIPMFTVTVDGEAYDGGTVQLDDVIKLIPEDDMMITSVSYKIGDGEAIVLDYNEGYAVPASAIVGNVEIIVTKLEYEPIDHSKHGALADNTELVIITADNNKAYSLTVGDKSADVYYSDFYGGFVFINKNDWTPAEIGRGLVASEGTTEVIKKGCITAGDTKITAADAAIVSEMLHNKNGNYSDYIRIAADFTDSTELSSDPALVTAADCMAILYASVKVEVTSTSAN